jgi:Arc/MetJ-type ribon-helix-helix transcriptional regulator
MCLYAIMFLKGVMKMTLTKPKTKKKINLKRTTIFLTEEHHEELRRLAFERRTSMANLIREAVLEMIELEEDEKTAIEAANEPEEGYITLEELDKRWKEKHKNE